MAIDFNKPATTDNYASGFVPAVTGALAALGQWLDTAYTTVANVPVGAKRYSAGAIQSWNGTSWVSCNVQGLYYDGSNTGVGTAAQIAKLHVAGRVLVDNGFDFAGRDSAGAARSMLTIGSDNGVYVGALDRTDSSAVYLGGLSHIFYGVEGSRARLDASGNWLVGTGAPYLSGDRAAFVASAANADAGVSMVNLNSGAAAFARLTLAAYGGDWHLRAGSAAASGNAFTIARGGSEFVRVDAGGSVGIGTASPLSRLHLVGDLQFENANYAKWKVAAGGSTRLFGLNSADDLYVGGIDLAHGSTLFVRGGTVQATISPSGNFGVGVSPATRLHVAGGTPRLRLEDTAAAGAFDMVVSGASLRLELAGGAERLRIDGSGSMGLGTAAPLRKLDVVGGAMTRAAAVAFSTAVAIDASASNLFILGTLTAGVATMTISNGQEGQFVSIRVRQDGTGGRTVAVPAGAAVAGSVNTAANKTSYLNLTWNATDARWEGSWSQIP